MAYQSPRRESGCQGQVQKRLLAAMPGVAVPGPSPDHGPAITRRCVSEQRPRGVSSTRMKKKKGCPTVRLFLCLVATLVWSSASAAQETGPETPEPAMTVDRLAAIVEALDPDVIARGPVLEFTLEDIPVLVIADPAADRMRAMVPIASAEGLKEADLLRMMQANFDSALDARYAIAQGRLWGLFIHPLSPLEKDQFLSGLVQTITVARTYGTAYTGGGAVFGGGDSNRIYRDLLERLRKKGEAL